MFQRRNLVIPIIIVLFFTLASTAMASPLRINTSQVSQGLVTIDYQATEGHTAAVRVQKGELKKDHLLDAYNSFPLQFGRGDYTILVLENVSGNSYRLIESSQLSYQPVNEKDLYLQSVQMIHWNEDMLAIKKASELTKEAQSSLEKVKAIHDFILKNIKYDDQKALNLKSGYIPSIDVTLEEGLGICYDFSTLFAAMTRSLGIPTKVVEGWKNDIEDYHAWNEVYLEDLGTWMIIDTTYDAAYKKADVEFKLAKDVADYKVERVY